jgi:guanine deaminase
MAIEFLQRAVDLALENVAQGGGPFGAVIVRQGQVIATGVNRVTANLDPTAHAEVMAIRQACERLQDFQLTDAILYASCEPCPMCLGAISGCVFCLQSVRRGGCRFR